MRTWGVCLPIFLVAEMLCLPTLEHFCVIIQFIINIHNVLSLWIICCVFLALAKNYFSTPAITIWLWQNSLFGPFLVFGSSYSYRLLNITRPRIANILNRIISKHWDGNHRSWTNYLDFFEGSLASYINS